MVREAFACSEKYGTPVILRPTTRVCHSCADIELPAEPTVHRPEGFVKDTFRWVVFPRTSYLNHLKIEERNPKIGDDFSSGRFNRLSGGGKKGVACGGISYAYVMEALEGMAQDAALLKIATPHPFPEKLALEFLRDREEVLVLEELDPVIERELIYLCGKHRLGTKIHGKLDGSVRPAGENTVESVKGALGAFLGLAYPASAEEQDAPELPVRPPVLCAGCPHRASFYAVKRAIKGKKAVFSGDIGCYTLGNAKPLDMVDTCLCMGAGVTIAQGIHRIEPDTVNFAFIGDSTFFASGLTGVVNAVYNHTDIVLIVLDNATTAMTGHQPHPGTGITMMKSPGHKVSIEKVLEAIGVSSVEVVDPLRLREAVDAVKRASEKTGVKAVIFRSPCIAVSRAKTAFRVNEKCVGCKKCITELGCPAIVLRDGKAAIEKSLCFGCSLCAQVCPAGAITAEGSK
jgi:indolepyruvate ferredoxin oxidoreductase alpha subunit